MLLVGWNDDFRVDTGLPGYKGHHTVGGFIIKNSWNTEVGHSVGYWAQDHSLMDENFICPCENSAMTWLPAKADCMVKEKDALKCCSLEKNVLKEWVKGATILKCHPRGLSLFPPSDPVSPSQVPLPFASAASDPARAAFLGWTGCRTDMNYVLAALDSRP